MRTAWSKNSQISGVPNSSEKTPIHRLRDTEETWVKIHNEVAPQKRPKLANTQSFWAVGGYHRDHHDNIIGSSYHRDHHKRYENYLSDMIFERLGDITEISMAASQDHHIIAIIISDMKMTYFFTRTLIAESLACRVKRTFLKGCTY